MARNPVDQSLVGSRARPSCGHEWLRECPLTARDWEEVFYAYLAWRSVCRSVSERAHKRERERERAEEVSA